MYQPVKRYTFEQPKLKKWVESWCRGRVLNLFAGLTKLRAKEVRVDINPDMPADYHMDAYNFVTTWNNGSFDTVILDPPYNLRMAREKYNGYYIGKFTKVKNVLPSIMNEMGRVITLGYDTTGMSRKRGFRKLAIVVICHSGDHNDTLGVVEERVPTLDGFMPRDQARGEDKPEKGQALGYGSGNESGLS